MEKEKFLNSNTHSHYRSISNLNTMPSLANSTVKSRNFQKIAKIPSDYMTNKTEGEVINASLKRGNDIRKLIKKIHVKKKEEMKSFHKYTLLESYKQGVMSTFLTDTAKTERSPTEGDSKNANLYTSRTSRDNSIANFTNKNFFFKSVTGSANLNNFHSLNDFKQKISHMSRMKYCLNLQQERKHTIEEDIINDVDEHRQKIYTVKHHGKMMEEYFDKFGDYLRYLRLKKEIEQINLATLNNTLSQLKSDVTKMQQRRIKLLKDISDMKEYKLFLKSLKAGRIIKSKENIFDKLNERKLKAESINTSGKKSNKHKSTMLFRAKRNVVGIFSTIIHKHLAVEKIAGKFDENKDESIQEEVIYENAEDVLEDFKNLQMKVVALLKIREDNSNFIKKLSFNPDKETENCQSRKIIEMEMILKKEKMKNTQLLLEKERVEKQFDTELEEKIIYNTLHCLLENYDKFQLVDMNLHKLDLLSCHSDFTQSDAIFFMLKQIDLTLQFLTTKYKEITHSSNSHFKEEIVKFEKNLDKERKINLLKKNEHKFELRTKQQMKELLLKHNKIVIKGRKFAPRFIKNRKVEKKSLQYKKSEEKEFQELISF